MQNLKFPAAFILGILITTPALSKEDPMDTQRCIWACMANTPDWSGRNFKAYERCTRNNCSGKTSRHRRSRG